ncbi:MAG: hypothetical protein JWP51_778 [Bradyrhizobium sp.]|jgi:hypothetical protein|nr:hypothetical protein [Bradyrhizobium sp.]
MRVMNLPSLNIPDALDFAVGIYVSRLQGALRVPRKVSPCLVAYLAWPNDEGKRNSWMASLSARSLNQRGIEPAQIFEQFGGLKAISEPAFKAIATELSTILEKWAPVADVFLRIVDMSKDPRLQPRRGPSIAKAIDLCDYEHEGHSRGHLRRLWAEFHDVAHLIAAGAILAGSVGKREFGGSIFSAVWQAPEAVVAIANGFELFGLTLKPHGRSDTILRSKTAWRIPDHCLLDKPFLVKSRLSDDQVNFLNGRKATKSHISKP